MNWTTDRDVIVKAYYDCINKINEELFLRLDSNIETAKPIYPLVRFIDDRLSTVWFLTLNDKLWDADIIDRSVLEVLLKLMFIANTTDDNERKIRLREYWNDLWEINCIKHSEQSKKQLIHYKDQVSQLAHFPLILTEEENQKLKQKWSKKARQKVEQKWSFSEILSSLSKNYNGQPFEMMIGLAHEYRMCSHVAHGDETGINIIEERKARKEKQRNDVHVGHFLKLLSNCLAYAAATSFAVMDYLNLDKMFFVENFMSINSIQELERKYQLEVFNDPDYDKYKNVKGNA
jgi:hypothetical protein